MCIVNLTRMVICLCDKLPDSYNVDKITPDKVLLRFLKIKVTKRHLEIKKL